MLEFLVLDFPPMNTNELIYKIRKYKTEGNTAQGCTDKSIRKKQLDSSTCSHTHSSKTSNGSTLWITGKAEIVRLFPLIHSKLCLPKKS